MKPEIIPVGKAHRPLDAESVLNELTRTFPDFEHVLIDNDNSAFIVKESNFAGARVDVSAKQIRLQGKVPEPLARIVDVALLGTLSAAKTPGMVVRLKRFLKERYAS